MRKQIQMLLKTNKNLIIGIYRMIDGKSPLVSSSSDLHRMLSDYYKLNTSNAAESPLLDKSFAELNSINFDAEKYFTFKLFARIEP